MKNIILHHHLGLGDHFVCNGLVQYLSKEYDKIYLPCKTLNYPTVKYLYSESPKIKIFKIDNNEFLEVKTFSNIINIEVLRIGFEYCDIKNWDKSFYNQVNIDFSERYTSFYLPKTKPNLLLEVPNEDYILIHDESSVGKYTLNISSNLKVVKIRKGISDNLFSYLDIIYNAKEIHCINSSVFHLIDSISNITDKLYYHNVRKGEPDPTLNYRWKSINYD